MYRYTDIYIDIDIDIDMYMIYLYRIRLRMLHKRLHKTVEQNGLKKLLNETRFNESWRRALSAAARVPYRLSVSSK